MAAIDGLHLPVSSFDGTTMNVDVTGEYAQVMWLARGLNDLWVVRGEDTVIPGTDGRTSRNRKRDFLTIELGGFIVGVGATTALQRADARTRLTALTSNFDPTQVPATLVVDLEDGALQASIVCRPLNILMLEYPDPVFRPFNIQLEAVGADWVIA